MVFIVANIFSFLTPTVIFRFDISSSRNSAMASSIEVPLGYSGVDDIVMFATQNNLVTN